MDEARPRRCPGCGHAAQRPGHTLGVVGHGLRTRQVRGPTSAHEPASMQVPRVRRYRCRGCGAVLTVVPRGVARRYHFGAGAIAIALFLFGVAEKSAAEAVAAVGGLAAGQAAWRTLRRWLAAIEAGRLFASVRAAPRAWRPRRRVERVALALVALVPAGLEDDRRAKVFAGAARAARFA